MLSGTSFNDLNSGPVQCYSHSAGNIGGQFSVRNFPHCTSLLRNSAGLDASAFQAISTLRGCQKRKDNAFYSLEEKQISKWYMHLARHHHTAAPLVSSSVSTPATSSQVVTRGRFLDSKRVTDRSEASRSVAPSVASQVGSPTFRAVNVSPGLQKTI